MPAYYSAPSSQAQTMQSRRTLSSTPRATTSRQPVLEHRTSAGGPANYRWHKPTAEHDTGQPPNHLYRQQHQRPYLPIHQPQLLAQPRFSPFHQPSSAAALHPPSTHTETPGNAVDKLLPYCTVEHPLDTSQVIGLTDAAGSLKELVLLALGAKNGSASCKDKFKGALENEQVVAGIIDFFHEEFKIE